MQRYDKLQYKRQRQACCCFCCSVRRTTTAVVIPTYVPYSILIVVLEYTIIYYTNWTHSFHTTTPSTPTPVLPTAPTTTLTLVLLLLLFPLLLLLLYVILMLLYYCRVVSNVLHVSMKVTLFTLSSTPFYCALYTGDPTYIVHIFVVSFAVECFTACSLGLFHHHKTRFDKQTLLLWNLAEKTGWDSVLER